MRAFHPGLTPAQNCGTINQAGSYALVNDLPGGSGLNAEGGCLVIPADDGAQPLGPAVAEEPTPSSSAD